MMDTIGLLTNYLRVARGRTDFHQSHQNLYSAILICFGKALFQNPFRISRRELMAFSAIRSYATYHKCLNGLVEVGLIDYRPSFHPKQASNILVFEKVRKIDVI
ncbi:hypothetical protein ASE74_24070 [Pedobacter sp. Leaf216]|uniref:hypothetical protein n=1 Tax=Pedobacter sp. Leaf216 TaxID=1735684 RepID=UPI0006F74AED|nr:hypothetical protein [Pedobacter sp. Leaf216]KQM68408.1 hypothetical protein ASE74_24070 [Pedobacter sp. Leaf216]